MNIRNWLWQDYAEVAAKVAFAILFVFVGVILVKDKLGITAQFIFWPIWSGMAYFLVIREVYLERPIPPSVPVGVLEVSFSLKGGNYGSTIEREVIYKFTDALNEVLSNSDAGEYDGDEFTKNACTLYMYGEDPEKIYSKVSYLLHGAEFLSGAIASFTAPGESKPYKSLTL